MVVLRQGAKLIILGAGFGLALGFGFAVAWLAFGGVVSPSIVPPMIIPGLFVAAVYTVASWKRQPSVRQMAGACLLLSGTVALVVIVLGSFRPDHGQFEFLHGKPIALRMMPPQPGFVETAYTFRASAKTFKGEAESELRRLGFDVRRSEGGLHAALGDQASIYIKEGKVVGSHFWVDGDVLEVAPEPGWISVDVIEADIYPVWISIFLPNRE